MHLQKNSIKCKGAGKSIKSMRLLEKLREFESIDFNDRYF